MSRGGFVRGGGLCPYPGRGWPSFYQTNAQASFSSTKTNDIREFCSMSFKTFKQWYIYIDTHATEKFLPGFRSSWDENFKTPSSATREIKKKLPWKQPQIRKINPISGWVWKPWPCRAATAEICRARNIFFLSRSTKRCNSIFFSLYHLQIVLLTIANTKIHYFFYRINDFNGDLTCVRVWKPLPCRDVPLALVAVCGSFTLIFLTVDYWNIRPGCILNRNHGTDDS